MTPSIGVGSRLREYEIVAPLRVGGMAALYLGRRHGAAGFAKFVAIKVVHPHLARDPQFGRMFVDEALISARIEHPNVVHVMELGQQDGAYFLVMEYVHGVSLSQLLGALSKRRLRLSPELAVHIAVRVAEGLQAAHETLGDDGKSLGVVHRDISPQNVLLSARGHVKLIDFGIAKARGRVQQTTTTSLKGKIRYMSPEQAYGREVDARTDVYALAVVLWEMLTMRRMFSAENDFALLDFVRNPSPSPPSEHLEACPPALDAAVMHALVPALEGRTPSARELRRELALAMPSALALDSANLADLLSEVLGAELEEERKTIAAALPAAAMAELPVAVPRTTSPQLLGKLTLRDLRASLPSIDVVIDPEPVAAVSEIVAEPSGARPFRTKSRSRRPLALVAGALLALGVGGAGGYVVLSPTRSPRAPSNDAPAAAVPTPTAPVGVPHPTLAAQPTPADVRTLPPAVLVVAEDAGVILEGPSARLIAERDPPTKQTKTRRRRPSGDDERIGANGSAIMR